MRETLRETRVLVYEINKPRLDQLEIHPVDLIEQTREWGQFETTLITDERTDAILPIEDGRTTEILEDYVWAPRRNVQGLLEDGVAGVGGRVSSEYPEPVVEARVGPGGDLRWSGFNACPPGVEEVDHLPSGNMAFWRWALLEARGLDAKYTRTGSWREDTDLCVRLRRKGYRLLCDGKAQISHRAARWVNPWERFRPALVWAMTRDDAYFRGKNYGWSGVWGAVRSAAASMKFRIVQGAANFLLIQVHLLAWIPGGANRAAQQEQSVRYTKTE